MLQSYYSHPTVMLQSPYSHVTVTLQSPYSHTTVTLQSCYSHPTVILQSPYSHASHVTVTLQSCYSHTTVMLQSPYSHATVTLQSCYSHPTVMLQSHYSHTTVMLQLLITIKYTLGMSHLTMIKNKFCSLCKMMQCRMVYTGNCTVHRKLTAVCCRYCVPAAQSSVLPVLCTSSSDQCAAGTVSTVPVSTMFPTNTTVITCTVTLHKRRAAYLPEL
jgi:hypothetical protein